MRVAIGETGAREYGFRPLQVTTEDFRISSGVDSSMPAEYRVFSGRELLAGGGMGDSASLAVVNGAVAMALTLDGRDYLVETDPDTGELYALRLHAFDNGHACGAGGCADGHVRCQSSADGRLASTEAPAELGAPERLPASLVLPDAMKTGAADEPVMATATVDHPYFRYAPKYNASLRDIVIMWTSAKSQTGPSSGLSSKAASYFSTAARVADVYERQLGFRYLLQELILIASDSTETDPGASNGTLNGDLDTWNSWLQSNRPQSTFKWGHAALWTLVNGDADGVIGVAWIDGYGSSTYSQSVQEAAWGWQVHAHEFGHNVGAEHTSGGLMNGSLISGAEDFYTIVSGQSYTAARDIYNYMGSTAKSYVYGSARLRHPEEIPFGLDDSVSTAAGAKVTFNPLANDKRQVTNGALNNLRLVEVGQPYSRVGGSARVVGDQIEFTPAAGFTGRVWFTYTLGGDVGNLGNGWLHSADVVVTVGGNTTDPSQNPALSLRDDFVESDFSAAVTVNPLLNDEGRGRLWSGDVQVVLGPKDTTAESYSERAFRLVGATVVSGTGTLSLETRNMVRSGVAATDYTGNITYTPGANDAGEVVIRYTVMDGSGATANALITIARPAGVQVSASTESVVEDSGAVVSLRFLRSGPIALGADEVVSFTASGTASANGLRADYALAGQQFFDPVTRAGTVVIPAGQTEATVFTAILADGVEEGTETLAISITGSSSLPVSSTGATATVSINDQSLYSYQSFDAFTTDPATWRAWSNLKNMKANGTNGDDWFDWTLGSGSTPTAGTGPSGDHTSGSGKYFYAEATGNSGKFTILESPDLSVSGKTGLELQFWYHMLGSGSGSLSVDLMVNGSLAATSIWSRSGQQSSNSSDWKLATVDLTPYLPGSYINLRFRADIGSSDIGDIAIDDVTLVTRTSLAASAPVVLVDPAGCSVEAGQSAYLSVVAAGFPVPALQWYRNGTAIQGATGPSYTIASVGEASAGTYTVRLSNSSGMTWSRPAEVAIASGVVASEYTSWVSAQSIPGTLADPNQDPDGDGINNLFEYAYGLPAMAAGSHQKLPQMELVTAGGKLYLQMRYRRLAGGSGTTGVNYTAQGITYTVETSDSLQAGTWVSGPTHVQAVGLPVGNGDGTETVTVRRLAPVSAGGGAFMRLSVGMN